MKYPTLKEIKQADRIQLAKWYRFLPSPVSEFDTLLVNKIIKKFTNLGGMTPKISKTIGW